MAGPGGAEWCVIETSSLTFLARGFGPLTNRSFRVRAYNEGGWSNYSDPASFSTDPPSRPIKMAAPIDQSSRCGL